MVLCVQVGICVCARLHICVQACVYTAIFKLGDSEAEQSFLSSLLQVPKVNFTSYRKVQVNTNASVLTFPSQACLMI